MISFAGRSAREFVPRLVVGKTDIDVHIECRSDVRVYRLEEDCERVCI
jgi:hypothetical protein